MHTIDFDGVRRLLCNRSCVRDTAGCYCDGCPQLRSELLLFIDQYCAHMTLAEAKEWFDDTFVRTGARP